MAAHITLSYSTTSSTETSATIKVTMKYYGNGVSWSGVKRTCKITLNGTTKSFTHTFTTSTSAQTMGSASFTITKPQQTSNKSYTASGSLDATNTSLGTLKDTVTVSVAGRAHHTVSYALDGGTSTTPASQIKYYGINITLAGTPSKTGHSFTGWKGSGATTSTFAAGATYSVNSTSNATMTAQWKANTYSISYYGNGATSGSMAATTYTYAASGTTTLRPNAFVYPGYNFYGWHRTQASAAAGSREYTNGQGWNLSNAGNYSLYAAWTPISYSIRFNANNGTGSMSNEAMTYNTAKALTSNAFSRTGYVFSGWATSSTGSVVYTNGQSVKNLTTTSNGVVDLYAVWTPITYTIAYNKNDANATGSTASSTHTYDVNKNLTTNGFIKPDYLFENWNTATNGTGTSYSDNTSVKNLTTTNNATVNLYAIWKLNKYTITYNGNGNTGGSVPTSAQVSPNQSVTTATNNLTKTGYLPDGWNTATNGTGTSYANNYSYTPTSSMTLYAKWNPISYSIKYNKNASDAEGDPMENSSHQYDKAKTLTSNTYSRKGYTFLGWSKTNSATTATYTNGASVKNLTTTNNDIVNLYAVWQAESYTLTLNANNKGSIGSGSSWTGSGNSATKTITWAQTYGAMPTSTTNTFTLGAAYTKLYAFDSWNTVNNGTGDTITNNTQVNKQGNQTLYAQVKQVRGEPGIRNLRVYRCDDNGNPDIMGGKAQIAFERIPGWHNDTQTLNEKFKVQVIYTHGSQSNTYTAENLSSNNVSIRFPIDQVRYTIQVTVIDILSDDPEPAENDLLYSTTMNSFISAGDLLFDGYKDTSGDTGYDGTIHTALGGVANGKYNNTRLQNSSVKLYGNIYTVTGTNGIETALSEYLRMSIDSTDTKKLKITFGPYTS